MAHLDERCPLSLLCEVACVRNYAGFVGQRFERSRCDWSVRRPVCDLEGNSSSVRRARKQAQRSSRSLGVRQEEVDGGVVRNGFENSQCLPNPRLLHRIWRFPKTVPRQAPRRVLIVGFLLHLHCAAQGTGSAASGSSRSV